MLDKQSFLQSKFFHVSSSQPCPYIKGRTERRIFTELYGSNINSFFDGLARAGFRRSNNFCYAPACVGCQDCIAARVLVNEFSKSKSQRRCIRRNLDLNIKIVSPQASGEQYELFSKYLKERHWGGVMSSMTYNEFKALIEETPVETFVVEFRLSNKKLIAACLVDKLGDGFSAVYSFFDPILDSRGLGNFIIIWLIERAKKIDLQFVYLGFWIKNSEKMAYKKKFTPLEFLTPRGWERLST